jgi:hypothetical protein
LRIFKEIKVISKFNIDEIKTKEVEIRKIDITEGL